MGVPETTVAVQQDAGPYRGPDWSIVDVYGHVRLYVHILGYTVPSRFIWKAVVPTSTVG